MNDRMQGAVAAATLALVSAARLAVTGPAAEDHVALAASATAQLLP
jgi:hypothetical protein